VTPVLEKPYISVSINPENIRFLHFTNGGHTRKSIMAAPMFLRIKRSIEPGKWSIMYLCVRGIKWMPLSTILIFDFGIVPTVWYFFVFHFIHKNCCWCLILLYLLFVNMVVFIGIYCLLQTFISYIHRNPR
jgi:hypothetical protein